MFNNVKIGIAPINWTNDDLPELGGDIPFEQCIKEMAEAGYTGCEVGNKYPRDPAVLSASLDPHGLQISSAWFSSYFTEPGRQEETINNFIEFKNFLSAMGASVVNVCECGYAIQHTELSVMQNRPYYSNKQWQALFDGLERCGELARKDGMNIAYHPHLGTGVQSYEEIDTVMQNTDKELVPLLVDTGHLISVDLDPVEIIRKYKNRIKNVHLKDLRYDVLEEAKKGHISFLEAVKEGIFTVPGDGFIDFQRVFSELSDINYEGWMIVEAEQDPAKAHPLTYAKKGREFIRQLIGI